MDRAEFLELLPELKANYQSSNNVTEKLNRLSFVATVSPTSMGKTTVMRGTGWPMVVTETTRDPRPGEVEGIDMNFNQDYDQLVADIKAGKFVQIAIGPSGDLYGTRSDAYPISGIATNAIVSDVIPEFRQLGFGAFYSVFITAPDYAEWQRRLEARENGQESLSTRMVEARRSLSTALQDDAYVFVMNDDIDEAIADMRAVVDGSYPVEKHQAARQAANNILSTL